MPRGLLALALVAALAGPLRAAETCPPIARVDGPPVHAILHGYAHSPTPHLDPLTKVDDDLLNMARFFTSLGLSGLHVHGDPSERLRSHIGDPLRPATWRALLASVDAVVDATRRHQKSSPDGRRPQVYLYFVGHGFVGSRDRLELYTRPERGTDGEGFDGVLDSRLVAEHVIRPLAEHADVHLIVDTCHGYHALQTRNAAVARDKTRPRPPAELAYEHDFSTRYPGVGALLASRELVTESSHYGGVFSHMVRSLAIGLADYDQDGIVTYGEMASALPQAAPEIEHTPAPRVVPPGLDPRRPFVDWRAADAARVCFSGPPGRFVLTEAPRIYATAVLSDEPQALWLRHGGRFGFGTWMEPPRYFIAEDGPVRFDPSLVEERAYYYAPTVAAAAAPPSPAATSDARRQGWEPMPTLLDEAPRPTGDPEAPPDLTLPWSAGGALVGGVAVVDTDRRDGLDRSFQAYAAGRLSYGRHQLLLDGVYAYDSAHPHGGDPVDPPEALTGNRIGGRAGYGYLLMDGVYEPTLAVLVGVHHLWGDGGLTGSARFFATDAALRATLARPFDRWSRWAWRFDVDVGAVHAGRWLGPMLRLGAGLDFETILR